MQFSNNAAGILKPCSSNSKKLQSESFSTDPTLSVQKQEEENDEVTVSCM